MTVLRRVLANQDAPLLSTGVVVSIVSGALAAGTGALIDQRVVGFSLLIGAILGFIVAMVPFFLALRLIPLVGALMIGSAAVALAVKDDPISAGVGMALLAFATAVWTGIPIVGGLFSSLPVTVFLLLVAKGDEFSGGASILLVAVAGVVAMVPPSLISWGLAARDPRRIDRKMTAALWDPKVPREKRSMISRLLMLDAAPAPLLHLGAYGYFSLIARTWLEPKTQAADASNSPAAEPPDAAATAEAEHNAELISAAIVPPGPLPPRAVQISTTAMDSQIATEASRARMAGWRLWRASQLRSVQIMEVGVADLPTIHPYGLLGGSLVRSLLHPDVSVFRYGVQRALALGFGLAVLVASGGGENAFWVVLTLAAVLQANAPSTAAKVARRTVGTLAGVGLAMAVSFVVPTAILVPYVAVLALIAGFAWMQRNYAITAMAAGFGVVLLYGAPTDKVVQYAGMRAVDVLIGGVLAALIARLVFPVRPRLAYRRTELVAALERFSTLVGRRIDSADQVSTIDLAVGQSAVARAASNLRTDLALVTDAEVVACYENDLANLTTLDGQLFAVAVTSVELVNLGGLDDLPLDDVHRWLDEQLASAAASPPQAASTAPAGPTGLTGPTGPAVK